MSNQNLIWAPKENTITVSRKFFYASCGLQIPDGYREENDKEFAERIKNIINQGKK